jgi:hypothetical protein
MHESSRRLVRGVPKISGAEAPSRGVAAMRRKRARIGLMVLCSCLAFGTVAHADPAADDPSSSQFRVFVDPRIPTARLPAAPLPEDRGRVLAVLRGARVLDGLSMQLNPNRDSVGDLVTALSALELRSDPIATVGHIIFTEDTLTGIPFRHAVRVLVRMSAPADQSAQHMIVLVDEMAPILAERQLGKTGEKKGLRDSLGRPEVERMMEVEITEEAIRGQTYGIRFALEDQALRMNRTELLQMLADARAERARQNQP